MTIKRGRHSASIYPLLNIHHRQMIQPASRLLSHTICIFARAGLHALFILMNLLLLGLRLSSQPVKHPQADTLSLVTSAKSELVLELIPSLGTSSWQNSRTTRPIQWLFWSSWFHHTAFLSRQSSWNCRGMDILKTSIWIFQLKVHIFQKKSPFFPLLHYR